MYTRFLAMLAVLGIVASGFPLSADAYFAEVFEYMRLQYTLPEDTQTEENDGWPMWIGRLDAGLAEATIVFGKQIMQMRTGTHVSLFDQVEEDGWPTWIGRLR